MLLLFIIFGWSMFSLNDDEIKRLNQRDNVINGSLDTFIRYLRHTDQNRRIVLLICIKRNLEAKVKYLVEHYPHECHLCFKAKDTPWEYLSYANKELLSFIFNHSTFSYKTSIKKLMNFAAEENRIEAMRFFCQAMPAITKEVETQAFLHIMKQVASTLASETFFIEERKLDCSIQAYALLKKKWPDPNHPYARYWTAIIQRMEKIGLEHTLQKTLPLKPSNTKRKI